MSLMPLREDILPPREFNAYFLSINIKKVIENKIPEIFRLFQELVVSNPKNRTIDNISKIRIRILSLKPYLLKHQEFLECAAMKLAHAEDLIRQKKKIKHIHLLQTSIMSIENL